MKLKKVNYLTEEKFTQLVSGEIEGKTYNPEQEQYLIPDEASGGQKLYKHVLNSSYIRDSDAQTNQRVVIYSYESEPYTSGTLSYQLTHKGYLSAYLLPGYGFGDYTAFSQVTFSSSGMESLVFMHTPGSSQGTAMLTPDTEDFTDTVEEV